MAKMLMPFQNIFIFFIKIQFHVYTCTSFLVRTLYSSNVSNVVFVILKLLVTL